MSAGLVSAVIVNFEAGDLLTRCVRSVLEQGAPVQVIVVDNGSTDGSAQEVAATFPDVEIVRPGRNLGFAGGVNAGADNSGGDYLLFLNPDVELKAGCLDALVRALDRPGVGVAGPVVDVIASGVVEYGSTIDPLGHPIGLRDPGRPFFVSGAALATKKAVFDSLGGFDDRFFLLMEDVDYCWRTLLAGYDVVVSPEARAVHVGGATMPGGYERGSGLETSRLRVGLRERNTLAMLLRCCGAARASWAVPSCVAQTLIIGGVLALAGKRRTAADVLRGLAWNARQLRRTLALRRATQRGRRVPDRVIRTRMTRVPRGPQLLLRYGLPQVQE